MENFEEFVQMPAKWNEFLEYRLSDEHVSEAEKEKLVSYMENKRYIKAADDFLCETPFPAPALKSINKHSEKRKRDVFTFPEDENIFLKFVAFYLMRYDNGFPENLCSFRKNICVKTAVKRLINIPDISKKFSYKADVRDYFNSVNTEILFPQLKEVLKNDLRLCSFIEKLLSNPFAQKDGQLVRVRKGIMAGVPVSAFLANLYLMEMDRYFETNNITYVRYSDDIIVFAKTPEEIDFYRKRIVDFLNTHAMTVNKKKEVLTFPGEKWEFLGFSYCNGVVDISETAVNKMKKKMKRKAAALVRWKEKNKADSSRAVRAFIKKFNKKFFEGSGSNDITWARWYFPVINTAESLHVLDAYMQDCIRYIANGNYSKSRFNFRYEDMKKLGYISLVNAFYAWKTS